MSYEEKLCHNYHELTIAEAERYWREDKARLSEEGKFFFEGCLSIPGQMYVADRKALFDAILQHKPVYCFEVGTYTGGGSTFFLASAFARLERGKVITLEADEQMRNHAVGAYRQFLPGLLPFVEFLHGGQPSHFMPYIEGGDGIVECVFLDGAEDDRETLEQYEFFAPFFRPGSILMAHDWNTEKARLLKPIIADGGLWSIEVELNEPASVGFIVAYYQG